MSSTQIVIHPAVEPERFAILQSKFPSAHWVNAATPAEALAAMPEADAFGN